MSHEIETPTEVADTLTASAKSWCGPFIPEEAKARVYKTYLQGSDALLWTNVGPFNPFRFVPLFCDENPDEYDESIDYGGADLVESAAEAMAYRAAVTVNSLI